MSVLVANRKESRFEPITFSCELHGMLIELMQRGFGIKNLESIVRRKYICGQIDTENIEYFRFLMNNAKKRIDEYAAQMTSNIRAANTIYPVSMQEYERRREFQNAAIINCEQIVKELQRIVEIYDVDVNLYSRYIQAIDREIGLIKKWRQRDNQIKSHIQGSA